MSKVLAVGDIHQKDWIIDKVRKIADQYDHVVLCGDYVDNWGATAQDRIDMFHKMIDFTKEVKNAIVLSGNHDLCYHDKDLAGMYSGWDYEAQELVNNDPEIKLWLADIRHVEFIDGVAYSHAGLTADWDENREPMAPDGHMWVRPYDGYVYRPFQVFGHTPSTTCTEVQENVWCIDTFSQYRDGQHVGDCTVLEIIDGKKFNKISL